MSLFFDQLSLLTSFVLHILQNICAYVFMPFSFMMGVDWEDSFIVGGLLGYKTFFNEFVAYERLSKLIHNREKGGSMYINDVKQYMTVSSIFFYKYLFNLILFCCNTIYLLVWAHRDNGGILV